MGIFNRILMNDETIFKNKDALDPDYIPKMVPYRESEQQEIAYCIKPLINSQNGSNVAIFGKPGIGKTLVLKKILEELEDYDINNFYINCWKYNTTFKIYERIATKFGFFVTNKDSGEVFNKIQKKMNEKPTLLIFDEVDKISDYDFLYNFLENLNKKSIILIANQKDWYIKIDQRIKSRLMPKVLDFNPYTMNQTMDILKKRSEIAFLDNVINDDIIAKIVNMSWKNEDIRVGVSLLKEVGNVCEANACRKITNEHLDKVLKITDDIGKKEMPLEDDLKTILEIIKENDNQKIGDIYQKFQEKTENDMSYKTFQRRIKKLSDLKRINLEVINGGDQGKTSIISLNKIKE
ncbi:MAG: AAA family ATPase [Candidatus Nanoarchaeia archaeon]|nr:AAA family ATPase [Candidatus Nanoarchaeia archaeon]